jgi:malonyl-CoA decarboxylase
LLAFFRPDRPDEMVARDWLGQFVQISQRGRQRLGSRAAPLPARDDPATFRRLLGQRGEASSLVLAAEILAAISNASDVEIKRLLEMLAREFRPDPDAVSFAAREWLAAPNDATLAALSNVVDSPRQELFRRLNMVPGGTSALLALRAHLLRLVRDHQELAPVDADLKHLFTSWFNRGFLELAEITWETSADILERITGYEAVHQMRGWKDLRGRLAADRRCFAFFHPALPREPLIFVEIALTHGLASSVGSLIRVDREVIDPSTADTAIFYSINNTQAGLRGISFGSFLIKHVMGQLAKELPQITTYATISPMRHFASLLRDTDNPDGFTAARMQRLLGKSATILGGWTPSEQAPPASHDRELHLLGLAYLTKAKVGLWAADPVAHFHLANGARIERVNLRADVGDDAAGSLGLMVNYLYDAGSVEANHEQYVEHGRIALAAGLTAAMAEVDAAWDAP